MKELIAMGEYPAIPRYRFLFRVYCGVNVGFLVDFEGNVKAFAFSKQNIRNGLAHLIRKGVIPSFCEGILEMEIEKSSLPSDFDDVLDKDTVEIITAEIFKTSGGSSQWMKV